MPNGFTTPQASLVRDRTDHRAGQHRPGLLHPAPVDQGIQQHGEQEVRRRTGGHDRGTGTQGLVVEGQVPILCRDRAFTLVEHLDVTAQRERTDHKLRGLPRPRPPGFPSVQHAPESH
jgi:hypothetical protein